MGVASLHRFLLNRIVANAAWFALVLSLVAIALFVFGVTGVVAANAYDPDEPFRWGRH
jgi:TM2 domain-containing membrane protein YozV